MAERDDNIPEQKKPNTPRVVSTSERFERILQHNGMSQKDFQDFLDLPYENALQAARDAVAGDPKYAFLMTNNGYISELPENLMAEDPSPEDRVKQIFTDRIFEFYLMKFCHSCSNDDYFKYVKITGLDILERQRQKNKGLLLLNSHYGPGHVVQIILSRLGYPMTTISSRNFYDQIGVDSHSITVEEIAGNFGAKIIAVGCSVLNDNKILHMTGEGATGRSGRAYPFLGKKWHIPSGFAYMVEQTDANCLPVFASISDDGRIQISIKPRIAPNSTIADRNTRIEKMVQRYVNLVKAAWRDDPANVPPVIIRNHLRRGIGADDKLPQNDTSGGQS